MAPPAGLETPAPESLLQLDETIKINLHSTWTNDDLNSSEISAESSRFSFDAWFTSDGESL